jgi:hypothetical protein
MLQPCQVPGENRETDLNEMDWEKNMTQTAINLGSYVRDCLADDRAVQTYNCLLA